jgi:parallel beta-helix repeat protein
MVALSSSVTVERTTGVELCGVRVRGPALKNVSDPLRRIGMIYVHLSGVAIEDCAVLGAVSTDVVVSPCSRCTIKKSLVAAAWWAGVDAREDATLRLADCDIRNNYYAGVTLSTNDAIIERCRISGSAWHGIRYDDCSPKILDNQIFSNARSGIYGSGETAALVRGNVFWGNEMDAISCWFANTDRIEGNTMVDNLRAGIAVLGGSKPTLAHNVFVKNPVAVECGAIASRDSSPPNPAYGEPIITANFFFANPAQFKVLTDIKPLPRGNILGVDPKLGDRATSFAMAADSPARHELAGAAMPTSLQSAYPLQPAELAITPSGLTRDSTQWKGSAQP